MPALILADIDGERAIVARILQCLHIGRGLFPGLGSLGFSDLLEGILVPVEKRRRRIKGEGEHLALRARVVSPDPGEVIVPVDLVAVILHQLVSGVIGIRQHEVESADIEYLNDGRRLATAIGGDRVLHSGVIGALASADGFILLLGFVEVLAHFLDALRDIAGVAVPEIDLDFVRSRRTRQERADGKRADRAKKLSLHNSSHLFERHSSAPHARLYMRADIATIARPRRTDGFVRHGPSGPLACSFEG